MSPTREDTSSSATENGEMAALSAKACWECARRRLVCDRKQPVCDKCRGASIVCPGYHDQKPLRWLAPGKVLSRAHNRKSGASGKRSRLSTSPSVERSVRSGSSESEATTRAKSQTRSYDLILVKELPDALAAMVDALHYFNEHLYPQLLDWQLTPCAFYMSAEMVRDMSTSLKHLLITGAFSHCLFQIHGGAQSNNLVSLIHRHRGLAISSLNEAIRQGDTCSDMSISAVLSLMFSDVQQRVPGNWRLHAQGLTSMLALRGGIRQVSKEAPHMRHVLFYFVLCAIMGNTTCPSGDQITTHAQGDIIDLLSELYTEIQYFPVFPVPLPLLLNIVAVSEVRCRVAAGTDTQDISATYEAAMLLGRICGFSPADWAATKSSLTEEWLVMAQISHSAVILFCLFTLRAVLPRQETAKLQAVHRRNLFRLLRSIEETPRIKRCVMWPTIVAGFAAGDGPADDRRFVEDELLEMSCALGVYSPLVAHDILKRFWDSGKTEWDDCFDKPHVFIA